MEYDLKVLKINKNKIEQLNELSIYTVKDLVQHYPYRFEEMLETPLHDESKVIIEAQLIDEPKIFYKGRFSRLTFHVNYHEEPLTITIFNRHFLKKNMQVKRNFWNNTSIFFKRRTHSKKFSGLCQ